MTKPTKHIVVTGGGGQIGYSLLFRIASGEMLGADQPISLGILEVPEALEALKGLVMELEDCAFPLLKEIRVGSDPKEVFRDAHIALLVGAKPRTPGMERKELLQHNAQIFKVQGQALNAVAAENVLVLVVGNPCNTNCLIASHYAPRIPKNRFHAMMRLDQNRAVALLAQKAGSAVSEIERMTIWGNHSTTQVPDFFHAHIRGKPVSQVITDQAWLENEFVPAVQKRGAAVLAARGKSSAASAANAVIGQVRSLWFATEWFSSAVWSDGNPYGIEPGLFFSFPCRSKGQGAWELLSNIEWNAFLKEKIALTERELLEERALVHELLKAAPSF